MSRVPSLAGECGTPLGHAANRSAATNTAGAIRATPTRYLAPGGLGGGHRAAPCLSILFADLVGFTTRSEGRDPEETRELLSLPPDFDVAREIVERYGGAVEKFIGDAVMAVWGAPVAQEDDAERAVRAALDLVAGVRRLAAGPGRRAPASSPAKRP